MVVFGRGGSNSEAPALPTPVGTSKNNPCTLRRSETPSASGTFDDKDVISDVTFFDDDAAFAVVDRMHRIDNVLDLSVVEILHEIVAQNRLCQQLLRPVRQPNTCHDATTRGV